MLLVEREQWRKNSGASPHRKEREATDPRKLITKPLAKHCKGQSCSDKKTRQLESWEGVEGMESVGFSPDKHPETTRRGVATFVVFATALVEKEDCWALMGREFQLLNRPMRCEPKDPKRNVTLDRNEARLVGAAKGQRRAGVVRELPKPLGKVTGAGDITDLQEGWANKPTIADESETPMDREREEAIKEMNRQAN